MIIAVDGPAGSGKSTVSKILARRLGFLYIDTGAMYRALTLRAIELHISPEDVERLVRMTKAITLDLKAETDGSLRVFLDDKDVTDDIRRPQITQLVSEIAKIKEVRQVLVGLQRDLANEKDCVLDGRDIGTVVFPNAQRKFYISAAFEERVRRRHAELQELHQGLTREDVEADLRNRDKIDSTRTYAPLKKAEDAVEIDTTELTIEQVVDKMLSYIPTSP